MCWNLTQAFSCFTVEVLSRAIWRKSHCTSSSSLSFHIALSEMCEIRLKLLCPNLKVLRMSLVWHSFFQSVDARVAGKCCVGGGVMLHFVELQARFAETSHILLTRLGRGVLDKSSSASH